MFLRKTTEQVQALVQNHSAGRTTELSFMDKGAVVVKFRKVTVWEVYFPSSKDTDGFIVDKSICVYIADDV